MLRSETFPSIQLSPRTRAHLQAHSGEPAERWAQDVPVALVVAFPTTLAAPPAGLETVAFCARAASAPARRTSAVVVKEVEGRIGFFGDGAGVVRKARDGKGERGGARAGWGGVDPVGRGRSCAGREVVGLGGSSRTATGDKAVGVAEHFKFDAKPQPALEPCDARRTGAPLSSLLLRWPQLSSWCTPSPRASNTPLALTALLTLAQRRRAVPGAHATPWLGAGRVYTCLIETLIHPSFLSYFMALMEASGDTSFM